MLLIAICADGRLSLDKRSLHRSPSSLGSLRSLPNTLPAALRMVCSQPPSLQTPCRQQALWVVSSYLQHLYVPRFEVCSTWAVQVGEDVVSTYQLAALQGLHSVGCATWFAAVSAIVMHVAVAVAVAVAIAIVSE